MRRSCLFFFLSAACLFSIPAGCAQGPKPLLTPEKGKVDTRTPVPQPAPRRTKPLTGQVEHYSAGALIDANGANARLDRFFGKGRLDSGRLPAGVDGAALQGGADKSSLPGQAAHSPLESGAGTVDTRPPYKLDSTRTKLPGDISDQELRLLGAHDIVVIADRSSSMGDKERFPSSDGSGPRKMSRWRWCQEQTLDLTRQTARLPGKGITLVLFSSKYDIYENVTLKQVPQIFSRQNIYIGTRLVPPLEEILTRYFQRRADGTAKPLVIAIITDAIPQDDDNLCKLIIRATHGMRSAKEISITFLQVGTEDDGRKLLRKLDRKLIKKGARYDIVQTKSFGELLQSGLARSLIDVIQTPPALTAAQ